MDEEKKPGKIVAVLIIIVIIALIVLMIAIGVSQSKGKANNSDNEEEEIIDEENPNSNPEEDPKPTEEELDMEDEEIENLLSLISKTNGSLEISKTLDENSIETNIYRLKTVTDVNDLDSNLIMMLLLSKISNYDEYNGNETLEYNGISYEIGYVIDSLDVIRLISDVFGDNLEDLPKDISEVRPYVINISSLPNYPLIRYNDAEGTIEISKESLSSGFIESEQMYINYYSEAKKVDNTIEIYEKVAFLQVAPENSSQIKLYKNIEFKNFIDNFDATIKNGVATLNKEDIEKELEHFTEYKYVFTKDEVGAYHLKSLGKVR